MKHHVEMTERKGLKYVTFMCTYPKGPTKTAKEYS